MSRLIGPDGQPMETVMEIGRYTSKDGVLTFGLLGVVGGLDFITGWMQEEQEIDIDKACSAFRKCLEASRCGI